MIIIGFVGVVGDVNFAAELFDLRYRHKLRVILVHSKQVPEALLACAHEHCSYEQLIADLPNKNNQKVPALTLSVTINYHGC